MRFALIASGVALLWAAVAARAQGTAFSYQGRLSEGGGPVAGEFGLEFRLYRGEIGDAAVGDPVAVGPLSISNGLFNVVLDFGTNLLDPDARWLEISVRTNAAGVGFTVLSPRQPLLAAPAAVTAGWADEAVRAGSADRAAEADTALTAERAATAEGAEHALVADEAFRADTAAVADRATVAERAEVVAEGSIRSESVAVGALLSVHVATNQVVRSLNGLRDDVVLEGGLNTAVRSTATGLAVDARAWGLSGNGGTDPATDFLGTLDETPVEVRVNNYRVWRWETFTNFASQGWERVNVLGGHWGNAVRPGVQGATISGGGANLGPTYDQSQYIGSDDSTIAGGRANRIEINAGFSSIGGGFSNAVVGQSSIAATDGATIGGGLVNRISVASARATISGGYGNLIGPGAYAAVVSGGWGNQVNAYYGVIGGGFDQVVGAEAYWSTVAGGHSNRVESRFTSIGGGSDNVIGANARTSTIGGGGNNRIRTDALRATISGGWSNRIENASAHAMIGGGWANVIGTGAEGAAIPGGVSNRVEGAYGFAAGRRAEALHEGALVWADATDRPFGSATNNEAAFRATGGMRVVTAVGEAGEALAGVSIGSGEGTWTTLSDRMAKSDFGAVDVREVLDGVAALPLNTWRYRTAEASARHLGPMAQDFHATFGLGGSDRTIATVDADGVALAAIQGLYQLVQEQAEEIRRLRSRVEDLSRPTGSGGTGP